MSWLDEVKWNEKGLAPIVAMEARSGACHTGRRTCFFRRLENDAWRLFEPDDDENRTGRLP